MKVAERHILILVGDESRCPRCWGEGWVHAGATVTLVHECPTCLGSGRVRPS